MKLIDVTVTRSIPGPASEVFDVWLDPKSPGSFLNDAAKAIVNPVIDGLFYWAHQKKSGGIAPHFGRFLRLDRGKLMEYTWMSEGTSGRETTVSVSFEPNAAGTQVTIVHRGLPDDDGGRGHEGGWNFFLGKLETFRSAK